MFQKGGIFQSLDRADCVFPLNLGSLMSQPRGLSVSVQLFERFLKAFDFDEFGIEEFLLRLDLGKNALRSGFALQSFAPLPSRCGNTCVDIAGLAVGALQVPFERDYTRGIFFVQTQRPKQLPLRIGIP